MENYKEKSFEKYVRENLLESIGFDEFMTMAAYKTSRDFMKFRYELDCKRNKK